MISLEFVALTKMMAIRKAINYWYSNFYGKRSFVIFLGDCTLRKEGLNYIVSYKGPGPGQIDGY